MSGGGRARDQPIGVTLGLRSCGGGEGWKIYGVSRGSCRVCCGRGGLDGGQEILGPLGGDPGASLRHDGASA